MSNLADQPDALIDWAHPSQPPAGAAGPLLGRSVQRVEDDHLLRGDTTFVADLDLDDALVAHYVTSIEAHARLVSVDVAEATTAPGVVAVVTGADLGDSGALAPAGGTPRNLLATDKVRFVGEPIAVVVATSAPAAADAAELVVVDYEPLEPVIDPRRAADTESLLFDELGTNVVLEAEGPGEDAPEPIDFSAFAVVVTETFVNQRLAPCPMETRVGASRWTDDGRLVHLASCQGVHPLRAALAGHYGLEVDQVQVITADVGGSFGAKARLYPEDLLLPHLARLTGRTVRWVPTRSADMVGLGHSRAQHQQVTIGGDADGTIRALSVDLLADVGAYNLTGGGLVRNTGMILPGPYIIDQLRWTITAVVTNTTPIVAYRGAGRPEAGALLDRAVDLFAAEAGLDPTEVRRRNLRPAETLPWTNPNGLAHDTGDYPAALERVLAAVDEPAVRAAQDQARSAGSGPLVGLGLSVFIDRTAGIPNPEYGALQLRADGSFRVLTGSSPYGQGHHTTWAMLVAERTGVPVDRIEVVHGDSDVVPRGGITGGSRSAQRAGSAVVEATDQLVEQARARAAELLEAAVEDIVLDLAEARFHVTGAPGATTVGWAEIAAAVDAPRDEPALSCESDYLGDGYTVPYGAYAAVVDVDPDTGRVELRRLVTVDDAGTVINPMIVFGQVHGGLGQGVGQALFEEFAYDEVGNPVTGTFLDYGFPSAAEMPSFECQVTQTPSPRNLLGAKGIGESGTIGAVPAIQNAVVDAVAHLGVRHIDLPLTPQRVWAAIGAAGDETR